YRFRRIWGGSRADRPGLSAGALKRLSRALRAPRLSDGQSRPLGAGCRRLAKRPQPPVVERALPAATLRSGGPLDLGTMRMATDDRAPAPRPDSRLVAAAVAGDRAAV